MKSHAFGIGIEAAFEAPGLPEGGKRLPRTRIERVAEADIAGRWDGAGAERLEEQTLSPRGRRPDRTIDRGPAGDYLLYARHFGTALISPTGDRVLCAPPAVEAWRWQRFLVGRVLPWAAVLRGRELFHASAVRVGDHAVAVLADSGFGKTSIAARMMLHGAGFVTDDVMALSGDDEVLAHPGPAIAALRPDEWRALEPAERRRLGRVLGRSGKTYVAVERETAALPLGGLYFLERAPGAVRRRFGSGVPPRRLLASAFIAGVESDRRLVGLLDLCARLEATVPIWKVQIDHGEGAAPAAAAIWEHACGR